MIVVGIEPTERIAEIRGRVTGLLASGFGLHYTQWLLQLGERQVDETLAQTILHALHDEMSRLIAAEAARDCPPEILANARQQARDLIRWFPEQQAVSAQTRAAAARFAVDMLPHALLPDPTHRYTQDWFSFHQRQWQAHFADFAGRPGLRFLEIGSFEGRSACWLTTHLLTGQDGLLVCVDPFTAYLGQEYNFDHNIAATPGAAGRVLKLRGRSQEVTPFLPDGSFDFAYVDGSHVDLEVFQDAAAAWRLIRPGGVVVFDDYEPPLEPSPPGLDCKPVLDAFLHTREGKFDVLYRDWQLAVRKHG